MRRRVHVVLLGVLALAAITPLSAQTGAEQRVPLPANQGTPKPVVKVVIETPKSDLPIVTGAINMDDAGIGPGGMIYIAPSAVGLIAGIITHALISESARSAEKFKIAGEANKVLQPYRAVLDTLKTSELLTAALAGLQKQGTLITSATAVADSLTLALAELQFVLTQDQRAWIIQSSFVVTPVGTGTALEMPIFTRVISEPIEAADPISYWLDDDALRLRSLMTALLAETLDVVARHGPTAANDSVVTQRTFRYREGGQERMERAQLVGQECDRVLVKNLRGWLLSIPSASTNGVASCRKLDGLK